MWIAVDGIRGPVTDWLSFCYSSGEENPGNIVANGRSIGVTMGLETIPDGAVLAINKMGSQESDFEFSELAIWNSALSLEAMMKISEAMALKANPDKPLSITASYDKLPLVNYDTLASVPAWGIYSASDYANGILPEARGNGRDAKTTGVISKLFEPPGNGATVPLEVIKGNIRSKITWPLGSVAKRERSVCAITRYAYLIINSQRIVVANNY